MVVAASFEPATLLLGFDFIDPVPKNFVVRNDRLVGVDAEALRTETLLGTGPAKALLRWLRIPADELVMRLRTAGSPDLTSQFAYANLCFRCSYARQKYLQRKSHLAPASIFAAYLDEFPAAHPRSLVASQPS